MTRMKSGVSGALWPALPAPGPALLCAMAFQLEYSQWWPPQRLLDHQLRQLEKLLTYAYQSVPYYRARLDVMGWQAGSVLTWEQWRRLPLLTRREVQDAEQDLISRAPPPQLGAMTQSQTSGSTGEPVRLRSTPLDQLFWKANTLRDHRWHGRDLSDTLAAIRYTPDGIGLPPWGTPLAGWGAASDEIYATGPAFLMSLKADIDSQLAWLQHVDPAYLLVYPTNLGALLSHCAQKGVRLPRLRGVSTLGETVTPALRARCREVWEVGITDMYSSQEFGYIALQCPGGDHYHVMAESVLVEILDEHGEPCRAGETGRLVISSLHNYAMPLIRYELRDYAEAGGPCACGRGLPTLARIAGRSRNMVVMPDGGLRWPVVGFAEYRAIAPIRQYQLVQYARMDIEMRLVVDRALTGEEEARLAAVVQKALGAPFNISFVYFEREIPRKANGKFEEFVCEVEA